MKYLLPTAIIGLILTLIADLTDVFLFHQVGVVIFATVTVIILIIVIREGKK